MGSGQLPYTVILNYKHHSGGIIATSKDIHFQAPAITHTQYMKITFKSPVIQMHYL